MNDETVVCSTRCKVAVAVAAFGVAEGVGVGVAEAPKAVVNGGKQVGATQIVGVYREGVNVTSWVPQPRHE